MKKIPIILLLLLSISLSLYSENTEEFRTKFNYAIGVIAIGKTAEALPLFQELYEIDPNNANINYLLGICYTEEGIASMESVNHLELAEKKMVTDYNVHSFKEERVPIYVYYYQVMAYSQNGMCEKAIEARNKFYSFYTFYVEYDYYIDEAQKWVDKCAEKPVPYTPGELPLATITPVENEEKELAEETYEILSLNDHNLVARDIKYPVRASVWGVQVGAFKESIPESGFENLKNVEAFMDFDGILRYVIGHFAHRSQAETLLEAVREAGYTDAFVVDVNRENRFSKEVLMIDGISLQNHLSGDVELMVQVGAFRDSIPNDLAKIYLQIADMKTKPQDDLTIMCTGSFSSYGLAADYRDQLKDKGVNDAFIVAFNKGTKISLSKAKSYLRKYRKDKM